MKDEIKEILLKDFNEILVKEFCTDWKEKRLYIELLVNSTPFSNLLNYITNLQTIEREYSFLLSENAELENKITNLQEQLHKASLDIQELTERDLMCPTSCDKLTNLQEENERLRKEIELCKKNGNL